MAPLLFALGESRGWGERVAEHLGIPLSPLEERDFEDGEHKTRPLTNVRDRDVFVVHSLYGEPGRSANDKLCRLLFFIGALRDASAGRINALVPYLPYERKDRKTKARDPVNSQYVARLFEAMGVDRVVGLEVHNVAAFQNAFRCRTEHLDACKLFADYFAPRLEGEGVVVVSPDAGGVKRAESFRQALNRRLQREAGAAFMEKYRSAGVVSGEAVIGKVRDKTVIIIDDLISTGTTIARATTACRERGATRVYVAATHGLFTGEANKIISTAAFEKMIITDSVPPFRLDPALVRDKLVVLEAAGLYANALRAIHEGGSIVELLES